MGDWALGDSEEFSLLKRITVSLLEAIPRQGKRGANLPSLIGDCSSSEWRTLFSQPAEA